MAPRSSALVSLLTITVFISPATSVRSDEHQYEQQGEKVYPMMQKYMSLLHSKVGEFKGELAHLDELGSKAEQESHRFGEHVSFLDSGLDNFRSQVKKFRKVVAHSASEQLGRTRKVLEKGDFTGAAGTGAEKTVLGFYTKPGEDATHIDADSVVEAPHNHPGEDAHVEADSTPEALHAAPVSAADEPATPAASQVGTASVVEEPASTEASHATTVSAAAEPAAPEASHVGTASVAEEPAATEASPPATVSAAAEPSAPADVHSAAEPTTTATEGPLESTQPEIPAASEVKQSEASMAAAEDPASGSKAPESAEPVEHEADDHANEAATSQEVHASAATDNEQKSEGHDGATASPGGSKADDQEVHSDAAPVILPEANSEEPDLTPSEADRRVMAELDDGQAGRHVPEEGPMAEQDAQTQSMAGRQRDPDLLESKKSAGSALQVGTRGNLVNAQRSA